MSQFSEKLLVAFLGLVLGLSPLQDALAGLGSSLDQKTDAQLLSDMHCAVSMEANHASPDDHQCNTQQDCHDRACSAGHCASCVLALLSESFRISKSGNTSDFPAFQSEYISSRSASFFRPPRA